MSLSLSLSLSISFYVCLCVILIGLCAFSLTLSVYVVKLTKAIYMNGNYIILNRTKMETARNEQQKKTMLCVCSYETSVVNLVHTHKTPTIAQAHTLTLLILETHIRVKQIVIPLKFNRCYNNIVHSPISVLHRTYGFGAHTQQKNCAPCSLNKIHKVVHI